jgi:hypothetical protein
MRELLMKYKKLYHDHAEAFERTFNMPLAKYWDIMFGFDICKFNDDIGCPTEEEISLEEFITQKYGAEASKLITKLL